MPVVEISMLHGRAVEEIRTICTTVHEALVKHYEIPVEDRFQIVRQCQPHELLFDATFAGGPRSNAFVLIQITAGRERPVEVKRALFAEIATSLQAHADIDPEDVFIMLGNVKTSDLSLAAGRPFGV
jgi:phenylpyruvate tautomerase PptA (4-oxalocrotonate tautomerase family)